MSQSDFSNDQLSLKLEEQESIKIIEETNYISETSQPIKKNNPNLIKSLISKNSEIPLKNFDKHQFFKLEEKHSPDSQENEALVNYCDSIGSDKINNKEEEQKNAEKEKEELNVEDYPDIQIENKLLNIVNNDENINKYDESKLNSINEMKNSEAFSNSLDNQSSFNNQTELKIQNNDSPSYSSSHEIILSKFVYILEKKLFEIYNNSLNENKDIDSSIIESNNRNIYCQQLRKKYAFRKWIIFWKKCREKIVNSFLNHCSTIIQKNYRGYRSRKNLKNLIKERLKQFSSFDKYIKGWKIRKIFQCKKITSIIIQIKEIESEINNAQIENSILI